MSNQSLTRQQRGYAKTESAFGTPATIVAVNRFLYKKLSLERKIASIKRDDITGYRTVPASMKGRQTGTWSLEANLIGSGIATTVPSIDPFLVGLFGQAAQLDGLIVYTISDSLETFSLQRYRDPSTVVQHMGVSCTVKSAEFRIGQDLSTVTMSGDAAQILDSGSFVNPSWGLTAFPSEPTLGTMSALPAIGFHGSISFGATNVASLRNMSIKWETGNDQIVDTFNSDFSTGVMGSERTITASFSLYDDDGTITNTLKSDELAYTPIVVACVVGNTTGNTWTFTLNGLILKDLAYNDQTKRWAIDYTNSEAYGTSIGTNDPITLAIA
jgi:hypothetical protein